MTFSGRFRLQKAFVVVPGLVLMIVCSGARACIHEPANYQSEVTEKTKEALLFHDGQNAHLIIKTNLQANDSLPTMLAWIIPLPSLPSRYEEASVALFEEAFSLLEEEKLRGPMPGAVGAVSGGAPASSAIRVHQEQQVGDYAVQPIEIVRKDAGTELNKWLTSNGFGEVPKQNQAPYLRRGAVFLAVTLQRLDGRSIGIKPLHIVYKDDHLVLPLKFSTHSGVFDVKLYTFTARRPAPHSLSSHFLERDGSVRLKADQLRAKPALYRVLGNRAGYLTRFSGTDFNTGSKNVAALPSDPALETSGTALVFTSAALVPQQPSRLWIGLCALGAMGIVGLWKLKAARLRRIIP